MFSLRLARLGLCCDLQLQRLTQFPNCGQIKHIHRHSVVRFPRRGVGVVLPPNTATPAAADIKQHLKDATTYDEAISEEQKSWPTSSYHDDHQTVEKRKKSQDERDLNLRADLELPPDAVDDGLKSVLLFPGQGAQRVGMPNDQVANLPAVKDLYETASQVLGYDLLKMSREGPRSTLDRTKYCQAAVVVASLAAVEALYEKKPSLVRDCVRVAGFSVGEITALIFSGVLSLEDGLSLVHARGEAMELASEISSGGMMTVFFGADHKLGLACKAAQKYVSEHSELNQPVCQIANHLYCGAKVIAGHTEALEFIEQNRRDFGIRKCKWLAVSGAFHTPLMKPAVAAFTESLGGVELREPRIPVYSNVTGKPYKNRQEIYKHLPKQMVKAVMWEQCTKHMFMANQFHESLYPHTIECGPGTGLTAMLTKLNGKAARRSSNVNVAQ